MKFLKTVVTAGLVLASSVAAHATNSAQAWLENYYKNPQPAQLVPHVYELSRDGYFTTAGQPAIAIGFFAAVFAQNPAKVDQWFAQFRDLPVADQRLLASALWQSGNEKGREQLLRLSRDSGLGSEIARLVNQPATSLAQSPVRSLSSMNLQWGAFLATGSEQHITSILAALGRGETLLRELRELDDAIAAAIDYAGENSVILVTGLTSTGGLNLNAFSFAPDRGIAVLGSSPAGVPAITWSTGPGSPASPDTVSLEPVASRTERPQIVAEDNLVVATGPGTEPIAGFLDLATLGQWLRTML